MSLEQAITELTAAVKALTAAMEKPPEAVQSFAPAEAVPAPAADKPVKPAKPDGVRATPSARPLAAPAVAPAPQPAAALDCRVGLRPPRNDAPKNARRASPSASSRGRRPWRSSAALCQTLPLGWCAPCARPPPYWIATSASPPRNDGMGHPHPANPVCRSAQSQTFHIGRKAVR